MLQIAEPPVAAPSLHEATITDVIAAMRADVSAPHTLDSLAERACLSSFHFARVFRAVTGVPPNTFLTALRYERAKELLLGTDLNVTDICFEVGYESLGTFTTRFKQLVGLSPLELRQLPDLLSDYVDLHAIDAPVALARPGGARLDGVVSDPTGEGGPTYIGLFPSGIAVSRPVAGTYLPRPGAFAIGPIPTGTYRLLVASLPVSPVDFVAQLQPRTSLFVAAGDDPVRITAPGDALFRQVALRPIEATDPPVLTALPALRMEACPNLLHRSHAFVPAPFRRATAGD